MFIEQKKIPFPVDNHNTNEELGKFACCPKYKLYLRSTELYDFDMFSRLLIICSVIAAIGYVLIGNGLYDEAIKHFSLLLQVRLQLEKHIFTFNTSLRIAAHCYLPTT